MNEDFQKSISSYVKSLNRKLGIENKSINTISSYNNTYKSFLEFCKVHEKELTLFNIKEDDIYAFIEYKDLMLEKQEPISASTINSIISHLKKLFEHIERNSDESHDFNKVFQDIKSQKVKRFPKGLSDKNAELLKDFMEDLKLEKTLVNIRNIVLTKLMMMAGLRVSEVITITMEHFTPVDDLYEISFYGKGEKQRTTYIKISEIEEELYILEQEFSLPKKAIIATTSTNKTMDRYQVRDMANSFYRRAGFKASGVHILRHTAAKTLLANGVSLVVVQAILGHDSLQTTAIYTNPTNEMVRKELSKVG